MTTKPEIPPEVPKVTPPNPLAQTNPAETVLKSERNPLESLFYFGYAESDNIIVFQKDDLELKVQFRTLTPLELRDVFEKMQQFESPYAQHITERIETLARAIVHINHMPLILTEKERQEYFDKNGDNPSPLKMARYILREKIMSMAVIDALYSAYIKFSDETMEKIKEAKKNSND
jgi:hypothetical protein